MPSKDNCNVRHYIWVLRIFAAIYVLVAMVFLVCPRGLIDFLNNIFLSVAAPAPLPVESFFVVLTTSMMSMLVVVSVLGSYNPRIKGYLFIHLTSKAVSVALFLYFFLLHRQSPYLVGALTDSWVIVVILFFYSKAVPFLTPSNSPGHSSEAPLASS